MLNPVAGQRRDTITAEERRLIDEAIAKGRVTVCPPSTYSSATYQYQYDPKLKQLVAVYEDGSKVGRAAQIAARNANSYGSKTRCNRRENTKRAVAVKIAEGLQLKQIASEMKFSLAYIKKLSAEINKEKRNEPASVPPQG